MDRWLFDEPLYEHRLMEVLDEDYTMCVRDIWLPNQGWNWSYLNGKVSASCLLRLAAFALARNYGVSTPPLPGLRKGVDHLA